MDDIVFADGIIFKKPSPSAPDFVIGKLSFKVEEAIQFLQNSEENGWCNCDILISKSTGKPYVKLDNWTATPGYQSTAKNVNVDYKKGESKPFKPKYLTDNWEGEEVPF